MSLFGSLPPGVEDKLLALITSFASDERPGKIDLGVGMYRDEAGRTPVMRAVKAAERMLLEAQTTKAYLGPEGDRAFVRSLVPLAFGSVGDSSEPYGIQTPGGGGALRLGAELIRRADPGARVWVGLPTWVNHLPIFEAVGLEIRTYPYFDLVSQRVRRDEMFEALNGADAGDVVLIQACCHNPTGADLDRASWRELAELIHRRGLVAFVDMAYQGFGRGLDADAEGLRLVREAADELLVAYSCNKNFGMYRDRVGALFVQTRRPGHAELVRGNAAELARVNWSMPPDHGAAVVRTILESDRLTTSWIEELAEMRLRVSGLRARLAQIVPQFSALGRQEGMFCQMPWDGAFIERLRSARGIYMPESGRANLAGLRSADVPALVDAIEALRPPPEPGRRAAP